MPWTRLAKPLLSIVLIAEAHHGAWAQGFPILTTPDLNTAVFTRQAMDRLCRPDGDRQIVDRGKLAWRLLQLASPFDGPDEQSDMLRYATSDGVPVAEPGSKEIIRFVARESPFGTRQLEDYTQAQKNAVARQASVRLALDIWLSKATNPDNNKTYRLDKAILSDAAAEAYFYGSGPQIVCGKARPKVENGGQSEVSSSPKVQPVLRQDVADIGATDLKKAKGARFSYEDDAEKGKTAMSAEGLVGLSFSGSGVTQPGALYWSKITPYVYYKSSQKRPASASSKDIDYFTPGIASDFVWLSPSNVFGFNLQIDASKTLDTANSSDVYNASIRFSPSFLGGPLSWINGVSGMPGLPVLFKTDLTLVARQHFVEDAGTNPELQGVDAYFGAGLDTMLTIYLDDKSGGVLSKLAAQVGYRYLHNSGGVVDIERVTAGLSYEIGSNATAEITYVNGRDANTLQLEEKWTAGLTLKY